MPSPENLRLKQAVFERHGKWILLAMLAVTIPSELWNLIAAVSRNQSGLRWFVSILIPLVILRNMTGMWLGNPSSRQTTALFQALRAYSPAATLVALLPMLLKPLKEHGGGPAVLVWLQMMRLFLGPIVVLLVLHLGFAILALYSPSLKAFVDARCRRGPFYVWLPNWFRTAFGEPSITERIRFRFQQTDRPTYQTFSDELINVLDDDEIDDAVIDHVNDQIDRHSDCPRLEVIQSLPVGFQTYYSLWWLRGEIENGGFFQFFVNKGVDFGFVALEGCKRLNRPDIAALLIRAIEVYLEEEDKIDTVQETLKHLDFQTDWAAQYVAAEKSSSLPELNKVFYKLPGADLWTFFRNNKHLFQPKSLESVGITSSSN